MLHQEFEGLVWVSESLAIYTCILYIEVLNEVFDDIEVPMESNECNTCVAHTSASVDEINIEHSEIDVSQNMSQLTMNNESILEMLDESGVMNESFEDIVHRIVPPSVW